ncbi:MAG: ribonuclease HIII [Bacilli bacterium]|jgi:ribonuclease HIII|nr:ribonuclease HIII [Acholeplasmataceae bacterium]
MNYTLDLSNEQATAIINKYNDYQVEHTNNYTLFRAKFKSATLTIFKTLTLLVQGAGAEKAYGEICSLLGLEVPAKEEKAQVGSELHSIIGTDEVGTGDFFGPIVVAGVFVPKNKIPMLLRLGIKDSKKVSDEKVRNLGPILMKDLQYSMLILDNVKYNYLTRIRNCNMNKLKALLHNNVVYNILQNVKDYDRIIIDAFTTKEKYFDYIKDEKIRIENVELVEKAESKFLAVAAASIIARYGFIHEFDKLSKKVGLELPKGAGSKVDLAISKIMKMQCERYFDVIAKTNFKNFEKFKRKDS